MGLTEPTPLICDLKIKIRERKHYQKFTNCFTTIA